MFSKALSVLALLTFTVVNAQGIRSGLYKIVSEQSGDGRACQGWKDAVTSVSSCADIWNVDPQDDGVRISLISERPLYTYDETERSIVSLTEDESESTLWSVESAGPNVYTVKLPNEDRVWTSDEGRYKPILLSPAQGSASQRWNFVPLRAD